MLELADYTVAEQIYSSYHSLIYRGVRKSDQQPVVLKMLKRDYPTAMELACFKREYQLPAELNIDSSISVFGLEAYQNTLLIVMEDFSALSLNQHMRKQGVGLEAFLPLALSLVESVANLHAARVVHKNITPANILINPQTLEVKLTDFAMAERLPNDGVNEQAQMDKEELDAAYLSPEQTGRINQHVDYRSDLYSLGITLYQLLAGTLPFQADEPLQYVHCHIAKRPRPLWEVSFNIPEVLSDIIMKLLAKNADERYQSALGLKHDLQVCQKMLNESGSLEHFPIGQKDYSTTFQIPQKLYGREQEIQQLIDAYERVTDGQTEMVLISGYSGVGKTALVKAVHRPMQERNGFFCSGKFDQYQRNIPYYAISRAFNQFCDFLLSRDSYQLNQWRIKILMAVGANGQVLLDVIPNLEAVIGPQPGIPELAPSEAQNRFNLVFQNFFHVLCDEQHPFILFIDDLQWADSASLNLLRVLIKSYNSRYLLIIGAYRDNELEQQGALSVLLEELKTLPVPTNQIQLGQLKHTDIYHLIKETFDCDITQCEAIVDLIEEKTRGNAFFIQQFLKELYEERVLQFDYVSGRWQWQLVEVRQKGITDNVIDLMTRKIARLSSETQETIRIAACMGNQFDLQTLAILMERSADSLLPDLWPAVVENLISTREGGKAGKEQESKTKEWCYSLDELADDELNISFSFIHDRIQQAAYRLIPVPLLAQVHLRLGRLLLKHVNSQYLMEWIFEIVRHLNLGRELIDSASELKDLAGLNLKAGHRAIDSAAYHNALHFYQQATLSEQMNWESDYEFYLELSENAANAAFLSNMSEELANYSQAVLQHAHNETDKVEVYRLLIQQLNAEGKCEQALHLGLEVLTKLGYPITEVEDMQTAINAMSDFNKAYTLAEIKSFKQLQKMQNKTALKAAEVMVSLLPSTFIISRMDICIMLLIHSLQLYTRLGNAPVAPFAYGLYGGFNFIFLNRVSLSKHYADITMNLLEDSFYSRNKSRGLHMVGFFIYPWIKPLDEGIEILLQGVQAGKDLGDKEFSTYNADAYALISLWSGLPLKQVFERNQNMLDFTYSQQLQTAYTRLSAYHEVLQNLIQNSVSERTRCYQLMGRQFNEETQIPQLQNAAEKTGLCYIYANKLFLAYLFGEQIACLELAEKQAEYEMASSGIYIFAAAQFYRALVWLSDIQVYHSYRDQVEEVLQNLKRWSKTAPESFSHKVAFIQAEQAAIENNQWQAVKAYEKAIDGAKQHGFLQEQALANERFAKFWLAQGNPTIAVTYLQECRYQYFQWGALAKVRALELQFPQWLGESNTNYSRPAMHYLKTPKGHAQNTTEGIAHLPHQSLDLNSVIKASQMLSGEIVLAKLLTNMLHIVIENAGAEKGVLLLKRDQHWLIEAQGNCERSSVSVLQSLPIEEGDYLPESLIHYVARTGEDVVLANAASDGRFSHEDYFQSHQSKSVLVMPILNQGKLNTIIYLENQLIPGAFTPERIEVLKLLSIQMSISLENSLLYEQLEKKVAERTEALQQSLDDLTKTQVHLVEVEKMASLGRLVAGVAHEINTPLGICVTGTSYLKEKTQQLSESVQHGTLRKETFNDFVDSTFKTTEILTENLGRASALIQNFKQVSVDVSSEMLRTFNLPDYLHTIVQSLQPELRHSQHQIEIDGEVELVVESYPGTLSQIVTNLVMNSHYHAFDKGVVGHILMHTAKRGDWAILVYSDDGKGMSEMDQSKVFEPFFTTRRDLGGSGLGMFIVYNLVTQSLGGEISCESTPDYGTRFEIKFPIKVS